VADNELIQPRCLSVEQASLYIGVSANTFLRMVASGKAPKPIAISNRRKVWDKRALDKFIDDLNS
jgi:predicted DNA-binding transcriptional regulator AlpA